MSVCADLLPLPPSLLRTLMDLLHLELLHLLTILHIGVLLELGPEHVSEGDALGTL